MKVYFRGGKIKDYEREENNEDWESREDAYSTIKKGIFQFKLLPVEALGGGLIYSCTNDDAKECRDCRGEGEHECGECEGTGRIDCEECDAMGFIESDEELTKRKKREEKEALEKAEMQKNQLNLF